MKTKTINISLPAGLYEEAKKYQKKYHYSAVSELVRDALRWWLNPRLTRNGFTPEFERQVLRAEKEPVENSVEWDGKTPFGEFVLTHPPKRHDKRPIHRNILRRLQKARYNRSNDYRKDQPVHAVV